MLDKRCLELLNIINQQCVDTGYKVLDFDLLVSSMPKSLGVDGITVRECLNQLSLKEYVSIKYQDEKEVCLSPLPKGRLVFEEKIDLEIEKNRAERKYFVYAFLGALLGGVITVITVAVLLAKRCGLC